MRRMSPRPSLAVVLGACALLSLATPGRAVAQADLPAQAGPPAIASTHERGLAVLIAALDGKESPAPGPFLMTGKSRTRVELPGGEAVVPAGAQVHICRDAFLVGGIAAVEVHAKPWIISSEWNIEYTLDLEASPSRPAPWHCTPAPTSRGPKTAFPLGISTSPPPAPDGANLAERRRHVAILDQLGMETPSAAFLAWARAFEAGGFSGSIASRPEVEALETRYPILPYIRNAEANALAEIKETRLEHGLRLWKLYNAA